LLLIPVAQLRFRRLLPARDLQVERKRRQPPVSPLVADPVVNSLVKEDPNIIRRISPRRV